MTGDVPKAARELLDEHDAFEGADGDYAVTTTPFEATIRVVPPDVVDDLEELTDESAGGAEAGADDPSAGDADGSDHGEPRDDDPPPDQEFTDVEDEEFADVDEEFADADVEGEPIETGGDEDDAADEDAYEAVFEVEVAVPRLDAAVADDDVSPEVEDAWHSTLDLRLEDTYDVAEVDPLESHRFEVGAERVETRFRFAAPDARYGVNDAKVIVDFVEGTYLQGVIPGYEYEDPVRSLLQRATQHAEGSADGAERGGTPL